MAGGLKSDRRFVCGADQIANNQRNYWTGQLFPLARGTASLFALANSFSL
ncbi:MAG: hypothetical protein ACKPAE_21640 [Microcystis panniformis]